MMGGFLEEMVFKWRFEVVNGGKKVGKIIFDRENTLFKGRGIFMGGKFFRIIRK